MSKWIDNAIIYHLYTLGFCGAAEENSEEVVCHNKIERVNSWIQHFKGMGINTILFGPLFESTSHGYDTIDYFMVDKRLGTNDDFMTVCKTLHESGFHIILDGVFNHVGRDFFAFKDLQQNREGSRYKDWFINVNFGGNSPYNDGFSYEGWEGHFNLVKLNLWNPEVKDYLLCAVKMWIEVFDIDGLRLDVAYSINEQFLSQLRHFTESIKENFWLMGEMIHGDYNRLMKPGLLDSVTNYECYKGIYSSQNDQNYFEINYSMNRLFGRGGIYEGRKLYNFVDNHDVERIGSILNEPRALENVYTLLFTMPGIPSIYYGSEWGIEGKKEKGSDGSLRPMLQLDEMLKRDQKIATHIHKLSEIRKQYEALREGGYEQVVVKNKQLIFARTYDEERIYVALNLEEQEATLDFKDQRDISLVDILGDNSEIPCESGQYRVILPPFSGRILVAIK